MFPASHCFMLNIVYRQDDPDLQAFLSRVRVGDVDEVFLRTLCRPIEASPFNTVDLFGTRMDAMVENHLRLDDFPGDVYTNRSTDTGSLRSLASCQMPRILAVEVGMPVVLVVNRSPVLTNGLRGKVVDIEDGYPVVFFENHQRLKCVPFVMSVASQRTSLAIDATWRQVPLLPAWALTHRAQGMSLPNCHVHMTLCGFFAHGQAYVALSRATCKDGLRVSGCSDLSHLPKPCQVVTEFYASLSKARDEQMACGETKGADVPGPAVFGEKNTEGKYEDREEQDYTCCKASKSTKSMGLLAHAGACSNIEDVSVADCALSIDALLASVAVDAELSSESGHAAGALDSFTADSLEALRLSGGSHSQRYATSLLNLIAAFQSVPVAISSFCSWVQLCLSKLVNQALSQAGRRARFTDLAGYVHAFLCWPRLLQEWDILLKAAGAECTGDFVRSSCTHLVLELNAKLLQSVASAIVADDGDSEVSQLPSMPADNLGLIRHCGAWAVHKVSEAASHYVSDHISNAPAVKEFVEHSKDLRAAVNSLRVTAAAAHARSDYPSTLATTSEINRVALTFITDAAFTFFVSLEQKCTSLFSDSSTENFQEPCPSGHQWRPGATGRF